LLVSLAYELKAPGTAEQTHLRGRQESLFSSDSTRLP